MWCGRSRGRTGCGGKDGALRPLRTHASVSANIAGVCHPTPYTLQSKPYTLHPTPYTLHPSTQTLHPTPYTLHPAPYTLHTTPYTLHPTLHPTQVVGRVKEEEARLRTVGKKCVVLVASDGKRTHSILREHTYKRICLSLWLRTVGKKCVLLVASDGACSLNIECVLLPECVL